MRCAAGPSAVLHESPDPVGPASCVRACPRVSHPSWSSSLPFFPSIVVYHVDHATSTIYMERVEGHSLKTLLHDGSLRGPGELQPATQSAMGAQQQHGRVEGASLLAACQGVAWGCQQQQHVECMYSMPAAAHPVCIATPMPLRRAR